MKIKRIGSKIVLSISHKFKQMPLTSNLYDIKKPNVGIALHLTDNCNLKCDYCYISKKGSKSIDPAPCVKYIESILNKGIKQLHIQFTGGEPLIEWDSLKEIYLNVNRIAKIKSVICNFSIQTNGTLLNHEKYEWLSEHEISIGLSIDGPPPVHDKFRKTIKGNGSYADIDFSFISTQKRQNISINSVVTPETISNLLYSIKYLYECGFRWFVPKLNFLSNWSDSDLNKMDKEYQKLARWYFKIIKNNDAPVIRPILDRAAAIMHRFEANDCGGGIDAFALSPEMKLYPCSLWWALELKQNITHYAKTYSENIYKEDNLCRISRCSANCKAFQKFMPQKKQLLCRYEKNLTSLAHSLLDLKVNSSSPIINALVNANKDFCRCYLI